MRQFALFPLAFVLALASGAPPVPAQSFGPQGPEGEPARRQAWLVPTPDQITASQALLFRPEGKGPFRLALIAHASTQNKIRRAQMAQPEYRALAAALVARGFAVLVPERPGHGRTGGPYLEDQEGCEAPDYALAAQASGDSIAAALEFMRTQSFVSKEPLVLIGHSAGGWGALALADRGVEDIAAIIAFAPGRGGHADERANQVCAPDRLIATAARFGEEASVPVTWLVAQNDSYFSPELSRRMMQAFRKAGSAKVHFQVLPPFGNEGHWLAEAASADELGPLLDAALSAAKPATGTKK